MLCDAHFCTVLFVLIFLMYDACRVSWCAQRFLFDIYSYMREASGSTPAIAQASLPPSLALFISVTDRRMRRRQRFYANMVSGRLAGNVTTYFAKSIPQAEEQTYPFLYEFPYTQEACRARLLEVHSFHGSKEALKVKRRWCVLDAQRLTYYKSRSKRLIKDYICIDPSTVRLISPPFCQPLSHTGYNDCFLAMCTHTFHCLS